MGATFYDNMKEACARKNTNLSTVLANLGRASGNTGSWKLGKYPRLDIAMEIAEYLEVTLDELIYGYGKSSLTKSTPVDNVDSEWIYIISHIPDDRQQLCKDFLRTHMVVPEKFADRKEA